VQVAIVSVIGLVVVTAITIWHQRSQLKEDNQSLQREASQKTAEIQRLETLLTPFRTIALEKFTGPEQESLSQLADYIIDLQKKSLEQKTKLALMESQIQKLQPAPLKKRMQTLLNRIDPTIKSQILQRDSLVIEGHVKEEDLYDLKDLIREDKENLIAILPSTRTSSGLYSDGSTRVYVRIRVSRKIFGLSARAM